MEVRKIIVWVLVDEYSGNASQCLGVAEALGLQYEVKRVAYNRLARLPNSLLGSKIFHITPESAARIHPPWPDIIIASGRRTVPVGRYVKRKSLDNVFLVQVMWPGAPTSDLDLISTPHHDNIGGRQDIVRTLGAPHNINEPELAAASARWVESLAGLSRPRIAVLVGGDTRRTKFSLTMARDLARDCSKISSLLGGSLMVSTSRRTNAAASRVFVNNLEGETQIFNWQERYDQNPYLGYLACSDAVIVTGDSMSMCTESCATGRPVFIFAPPGLATEKHRRLHENLYEYGAARPFPGGPVSKNFLNWTYPPINDAALISNEIRRRVGLPMGEVFERPLRGF
jgi:mitochondrial fission protein ELM1